MLYFNFTFSSGMLPKGEVHILKKDLSLKEARDLISQNKIEVCANPSHKETFAILRERYKMEIEVPLKPTKVILEKGDGLIVAQVVNLPRLSNNHQYKKRLLEKAKIRFMLIKII